MPIEGPHKADKYLLDNVEMSGRSFGMTGVRNFVPDRWLDEGEQVRIGELTFDIFHCPGHSPGSVVFFNKEMRFAHVGDVLFNGSVGRTDLPGGSHETLIRSITEKLLPLGDDVSFICGHGPGSSIGHERMTNPFHQRGDVVRRGRRAVSRHCEERGDEAIGVFTPFSPGLLHFARNDEEGTASSVVR